MGKEKEIYKKVGPRLKKRAAARYGITATQDQLLAEKSFSKQNETKLKKLLFETDLEDEENNGSNVVENFQTAVEDFDLKGIFQYAIKNYTKLGEGEGRIVFDLGDGKVVKIAKDRSGISQNKNESLTYDVLVSNGEEEILPEIFWTDFKYRFLIVEMVKQISESEFGAKAGISWSEYEYDLETLYKAYKAHIFDPNEDDSYNVTDLESGNRFSSRYQYEEWRTNEDGSLITDEDDDIRTVTPFEKKMINVISQGDLLLGDLLSLDHYGLTADGRLVLLDSGFTFQTRLANYHS